LPAVTPHDLLPEQKVIIDGENVPQWKTVWDEARKNARLGDFETSLRQYKALLVLKSNLEEARWELARLMMYLKRWDEAAELFELLLESEQDNIQYINALGKVMWEMAQYERAVDLFKKVYEKNSSDQMALAGLVEALNKLDRKSEALPYLEQLSRQEPTNRGVRRYLAFLYYEEQNYAKARIHLTILARNEDTELEVLYKTAKTCEQLGLERQASTYWERVLAREPANIEAHIYLAKYYEKVEQLDRSLSHLQAILEYSPEDDRSYIRLGEAYERAKEYEEALSNYGKYLEHYPQDNEILQRVVSINAELNRQKQSPTSLDHSSESDDNEQVERLKETIRRYEVSGRYHETIPLHRQLIELRPEDNTVLAALTKNLIALKENDDTFSMVEYLSGIAPDNKAIYRSIAELLQRMGRHEEHLAVLLKIHKLDPEDKYTTQELALLYLDSGNLVQSRKFFAQLSDYDCRNIRCLEARATLSEKLNLQEHGLRYYETLLKKRPNRYDIRFRAIDLAAGMGLLDTAVFHAGYFQGMESFNEDFGLKVLLADAYRESGYFVRAVERYQDILEGAPLKGDARINHFRIRSRLGIAESYEALGLVYEAEQALRAGLANEENRIPFLDALFHLSLETGRVADSQIWLQALDLEMDAGSKVNLEWQKELLQAEMYSANGDYDLAVDLCRQAEDLVSQQESSKSKSFSDIKGSIAPLDRIRMLMAASLLHAGEFEEAEDVLLDLKNTFEEGLELLVLLEQIYLASGQEGKAGETAVQARRYAAEDFSRQLYLAKLYRKYNDTSGQLAAAGEAAAMVPDSLTPKYLLVEAKSKGGGYFAALELLRQFQKSYPENTWFLSQEVELLAKVGRFQEALAVSEVILAENHARRDITLLQARIFWAMKRWKDSIDLYESVVKPPVEEILEKRIYELSLAVDQPPAKSFWWEMITFSEEDPLSISQLIMGPQHAVDFSESGQIVNGVSAPHFALYRWQDRFTKELSVRRSVMRREYYHAANKLENIIEEYGSDDFLLYDLAGLYSKLERLGDEAQLYKELEIQNTNFPGLAEAIERNNLKRRPQTFFSYVMQEDDGWGGYKAVKQEIFKGGGKYFFPTNKELSLDISRINYESTDDDQGLRGWRSILAYNTKISQTLSLYIGGGVEKLESNYDDTLLYDVAITGKIADEMRGILSFKQDVVADTIASLKRNIKRRDHKIELMFDLFPRLLLGCHYDFIEYSDDNWTNNYAFWSAFIFLPEPTLLKISYNYDFYDSREGQKPGVPSDDGFGPDDHPYWSPLNYWITKFSLYFKYQLSNDALARGVPSYYTIEYSLGYDTLDNDLHELKGSFNIEVAKNYILSASFGFLDLDAYQHEEALLSLMYRW